MIDGLSIGIGIVVIIQGATFFQSTRTNNKLDNLVTKEVCDDHRNVCSSGHTAKSEVMEKKMDRHEHDAVGVKYSPIT